MGRTAKQIITNEAVVLREMRLERSITMRKAADLTGLSHCTINHYEQGRATLSPERIRQFLEVYRFSSDVFEERLRELKKHGVQEFKDECAAMLDRTTVEQLKLIHSLLGQFLK